MADWYPLLKLITFLITTAHILGTLFYFVGKIEEVWLNSEESWIVINNLGEKVNQI